VAQAATPKELRHQVAVLKAQVRTLKKQKAQLAGKLTLANQRISSLTSENTQLKGELPDRVRAVAREDNIDQLFQLVIVPAHDVWPCGGTLFYGETFYGADFDKHTSDGGCY
jgi:hypothetical protein